LLIAALNLGALTQCVATPFAARASSPASPSDVAVAGARSQVAGPATLSPQATRDLLETVAPPASSEPDLVRRFKQACGSPAAGGVPLSLDEPVGASRPIWVLDDPNHRFFQVQSTLRYASPHLLFYVQDGVQVNPDALAASANIFEQRTYPMLRQYFGDPPVEPRITVFNGRVPGVGGYFSASDLFPQSVNPYSNERPMIFMNLDGTRPGTAGFDATLAHETQHFFHYLVHPQQDSWINEGASELAMAVDGYSQAGTAKRYLDNPDTQLDAWAEQTSQTGPYYGGGYLFLEYFAQRMGGYDAIKDLIATPGVSVHTFENYLAQRSPLRFNDLFRDFAVANLLNDHTIGDGRYGYERLTGKAQIAPANSFQFRDSPSVSATGSVRPYATRYVDLQPAGRQGDLALRFSGAGVAHLYNAAPHSPGAMVGQRRRRDGEHAHA